MSTDPDPDMTPAQQDALNQAYAVLGEHFEHSLIVINFEHKVRASSVNICMYSGGFASALGMATFAQDHLLHGDTKPEDVGP